MMRSILHFRPRYSLLTLLVLTALIAGGVKLWHGPHHVIERSEPETEYEYTYTRNWRGEKLKQGVFVHRRNEYGIPAVNVLYYRQGKVLLWNYSASAMPHDSQASRPVLQRIESELNEREWSEFRAAVKQEEQRQVPSGMRWHLREGPIIKIVY